jgi:hypothetical protein
MCQSCKKRSGGVKLSRYVSKTTFLSTGLTLLSALRYSYQILHFSPRNQHCWICRRSSVIGSTHTHWLSRCLCVFSVSVQVKMAIVRVHQPGSTLAAKSAKKVSPIYYSDNSFMIVDSDRCSSATEPLACSSTTGESQTS